MVNDARKEQPDYVAPPVHQCICKWTTRDTGTGFRPQRVGDDPRCPVHHPDPDRD